MANCSQTNNTKIGTSAVSYDSTPLPCTDVKACDDLNTILTKFDNVICSAINSVNILTEEVMNITEDIMIITEEIENINDQIFICCPICDFTATATELPVCDFTGTANELVDTCSFTGQANQLPDPTTTTTSSSSSTSTSTSSSTTTTTTTIPPCSYVLLADVNGYVLRYILATNTVTTLFNSSVSPNDLAHSNDKLWLNTANTIHEYDITLSPWSQTFNRNISTGSVQTGFALGKPPGINNKLVTVDVSRSPGVIVELDITNSPATSVDIATLPAGAVTPGDLLITDTAQPKILINLTSVTSGANGLYQYDYNTGAFEIYVPLGLATSAFGIYEEGNLIYLVTGPGLTYSLLPTPPYTVTLVQAIPTANPGQIIVGGSQLSECTEVTLTIPPTTTTTTTI